MPETLAPEAPENIVQNAAIGKPSGLKRKPGEGKTPRPRSIDAEAKDLPASIERARLACLDALMQKLLRHDLEERPWGEAVARYIASVTVERLAMLTDREEDKLSLFENLLLRFKDSAATVFFDEDKSYTDYPMEIRGLGGIRKDLRLRVVEELLRVMLLVESCGVKKRSERIPDPERVISALYHLAQADGSSGVTRAEFASGDLNRVQLSQVLEEGSGRVTIPATASRNALPALMEADPDLFPDLAVMTGTTGYYRSQKWDLDKDLNPEGFEQQLGNSVVALSVTETGVRYRADHREDVLKIEERMDRLYSRGGVIPTHDRLRGSAEEARRATAVERKVAEDQRRDLSGQLSETEGQRDAAQQEQERQKLRAETAEARAVAAEAEAARLREALEQIANAQPAGFGRVGAQRDGFKKIAGDVLKTDD